MGSQKDTGGYEDKSMKDGTGTYIPLVPEQWKEKVKDLRHLSVIKYKRIFQALIYLLKFKSREEVCERETNNLSWKKMQSILEVDDLFKRMSEFWPFGPKEEDFKEY
jgi:hypothetical protein